MAQEFDKSKSPETLWVLLRGLTRESGHWGDFPRVFEKKIGCRVLTLDLPGTGIHYALRAPTTIESNTDFLRTEIKKYVDPEKTRLGILALSMGGLIAIDWALRYPTDLRRAVVINTSVRGLSPANKRISLAAWFSLMGRFLGTDILAREEKILKVTTNRAASKEELVHRWAEIQDRHPVSRTNALRQFLAAARFRFKNTSPTIPFLVLNSLGDHLVHPDCSDALRVRWSVPMKRHAWAGHDIPLEDPSWVIDQVAKWQESLENPHKFKDIP